MAADDEKGKARAQPDGDAPRKLDRREVLKGMPKTAVPRTPAAAPPPQVSLTSRGKAAGPVPAPHAAPASTPLPGKVIAEEFMRGRSTNPLYLEESSK